jgi:hypothetical protein
MRPHLIKNAHMNGRSPRVGLAIAFAIACVAQAQERPLPDPQAFLARSLKHLRSNDLLRSRYTYTEKETRSTYDESGRLVKKQVRVYEVTPSPEPELTYRRLVSVNGVQPADLAKRDAEQQQKERQWLARREQEGLDERQARLRKEEIEDRKEQAVVDELSCIFDFRMTGREIIDERPAIVFTYEPRPGCSPRTPQGGILKSFHGQAWVDEQEYELVRLTSTVLDTTSVKFGFIVRLLKGSQGRIERRKIDGEAWLPTYARFTGSGRVLFVYRVDLDQETEYSSYRKKDGSQ